jgi:hypothetical protein
MASRHGAASAPRHQVREPGHRMVRIAISQAAFDAIARTLPFGSVGYEIWLERRMLDKLNSYRRAGESYSDVILRLAKVSGCP